MALIRGHNIDDAANQAVVLDLGDLRRQADQLREDATRRAEQILADARHRSDKLAEQERARAKAQGHAEGLASGLAEGRVRGHQQALDESRTQLNQLRDAWVAAAHRWDAERRAMVLDARRSLLELTLDVARRIVHRVPAIDPTVVVDQVHAAIEHVVRPADVAIRVNPADHPLIAEALPQLTERIGGCEHVHLIDDASIQRGGCIVTHGHGSIDGTLGRQIDRLVESLLPHPTPSKPPAGQSVDFTPPDPTPTPGPDPA